MHRDAHISVGNFEKKNLKAVNYLENPPNPTPIPTASEHIVH